MIAKQAGRFQLSCKKIITRTNKKKSRMTSQILYSEAELIVLLKFLCFIRTLENI